jgi:predicted AlkP superfamily phosphohydrolase/phosphomutase
MSSPQGPVPLKGSLADVSIYDVAPTVLTHFGLPVPADMIGRSLLRA